MVPTSPRMQKDLAHAIMNGNGNNCFRQQFDEYRKINRFND